MHQEQRLIDGALWARVFQAVPGLRGNGEAMERWAVCALLEEMERTGRPLTATLARRAVERQIGWEEETAASGSLEATMRAIRRVREAQLLGGTGD